MVGPSGCGKSTLLGLVALALKPEQAEALVLGNADVWRLWQRDAQRDLATLRATALGFVPQTAGLLPFLTVGENIRLSQRLVGRIDEDRVQMLAERLDIVQAMGRLPAHVSVGQRQRAAIARALAHAPALVLADEPTASVHPTQADDILKLLLEVADAGTALLMTTHDPARAEAAGFTLAPCAPVPDVARTHFSWVGHT